MIKKSSRSTLLIIRMFRVRSYLYSRKISLINLLIWLRKYEITKITSATNDENATSMLKKFIQRLFGQKILE